MVAECDVLIGKCYMEEGALVEAAAAFEEALDFSPRARPSVIRDAEPKMASAMLLS